MKAAGCGVKGLGFGLCIEKEFIYTHVPFQGFNSKRHLKMNTILRSSLVVVSMMALMALTTFIEFERNRRTALYDPDGPSPHDPPHSAWAKAGEGSAGVEYDPSKPFP